MNFREIKTNSPKRSFEFIIRYSNRVKDVEIKPPKGLSTILKTNKFDCSKWYSKDYCMVFMSDKNNRKILLDYTKEISYLVCPGGKYLEETEVEYKLINDASKIGRAHV